MKRLGVVISGILCVTWLIAASLAAADKPASGIAGTWSCQSKGGTYDDMQFTLYLEQNGEDVTGSVSSPLGYASITSASFKDGRLEIHIDTEMGNFLLDAKLEGDSLSGSWSKDQDKGTWVGKRANTK